LSRLHRGDRDVALEQRTGVLHIVFNCLHLLRIVNVCFADALVCVCSLQTYVCTRCGAYFPLLAS